MPFKRKIYDKLLEWKNGSKGTRALLVEGARRVGKSTIVEEFGKNEYESYILIDFAHPRPKTIELFDDFYDLDDFFFNLQFIYGKKLYDRNSLIIFDEVQMCPKARQAIKYLVADGRYDYLETGSLISIKKNVEGIVIPSEERKIQMYPLDYEEFLWAINKSEHYDMLRMAYEKKKPLGNVFHKTAMDMYRKYMVIGGMPQAVQTYLTTNNLQDVDLVKRDILQLYDDDLRKIDSTGRLSRILEHIPSQLAHNYNYFRTRTVVENRNLNNDKILEMVADLDSSKIVLVSEKISNPAVNLGDSVDLNYFKLYLLDTGLFITLMFKDKEFVDNTLYTKLMSGNLSANLGYLFENVVCQMLASHNRGLYYYAYRDEERHKNYEIDYIFSKDNKICPIEVKSSSNYSYSSLDNFKEKYSKLIDKRYIFHTKDYKRIDDIECLPIYLSQFLFEE